MAKKDYSDYNIEFSLGDREYSGYREVYWRICTKQLSWIECIFKNYWRKVYHQSGARMSSLFSSDGYNAIKQLKTYNDIMNYVQEEELKAKAKHDELVNLGVIWEDHPIYFDH